MRLIILFFFLVMTFSGCAMTTKDKQQVQPPAYSVTDDMGTVLQFKTKPVHIFTNNLSIEETLVYMMDTNRLVAVSEHAVDPGISLILEKARTVPKVVSQNPGSETILALNPDLAIIQENGHQELIKTLRDAGIKVYVCKVPTNLEMIRQRIINFSILVGEPAAGKKMLAELDRKIKYVAAVVNKIPEDKKKTVLAYSMLGAFGSQEGLFHDICVKAGVKNGAALAGLVRNQHLSKEKIIAVDPDVFVFCQYSSTVAGDVDKLRSDVLNDSSLATVQAVKNKKFIVMVDRYRYSASQFFGDAVLNMATQVYPEYFKEMSESLK